MWVPEATGGSNIKWPKYYQIIAAAESRVKAKAFFKIWCWSKLKIAIETRLLFQFIDNQRHTLPTFAQSIFALSYVIPSSFFNSTNSSCRRTFKFWTIWIGARFVVHDTNMCMWSLLTTPSFFHAHHNFEEVITNALTYYSASYFVSILLSQPHEVEYISCIVWLPWRLSSYNKKTQSEDRTPAFVQ